MQRRQRVRALWIALIGAVVLAGVVIPLWVTADSGQVSLTATLYADVIRFEADGAASLRLTIYDLAENELWSSGLIAGDFVDWDRTNERGERLANGYYLYLAQGWDGSETLVLNKAGRVVLLPGDQVELKTAPTVSGAPADSFGGEPVYGPLAYDETNFYISNRLGVGTDTPAYEVDVAGYVRSEKLMCTSATPQMRWYESDAADDPSDYMRHEYGGNKYRMQWRDDSAGTWFNALVVDVAARNLGINTVNATDTLTIECASGNAIAVYPSGSRTAGAAVFRVESDGDVYADGTVYSASTAVGSADVAERINVSEWVEAGDVVEIDPEHVGFFRKADGAYSRRVAGIISTSPGVILGNDIDPATDEWNDNRPVLAIAGRVPVKVSTENGPIVVGDLLVSSSVAGIAMKGDPAVSIGAVVGKAMEALDDGEAVIMAQVTLR